MELINTKEKKVLGVLYKLGDASISTIAKETLINRTALYHTVEGLLNKGLITKVQRDNAAFFQPIPLSAYDEWIKRQFSSLSNEAGQFKSWLKEQKGQPPTLHADTRYFEGLEGVKNVYADTWRDNPDKIIYAITDYDKAYDTLNDFLENDYFPNRVRHEVQVKSLLPKKAITGTRDIGRAKKLLRDMRFIDLFDNLGIEINIYGSKLAIIAFDKKKPSGVIIKNEIIAKAFKQIFEYLWQSVK